MFKFFKKAEKKIAAHKTFKFINTMDETDVIIVDETEVNMFKVNDIDDIYELVEVVEA